MPLDPSIIMGLQPQQPVQNPMDSMLKAQSMKSLMLQNQGIEKENSDKAAMNDIMRRNTIVDPKTGMQSFNRPTLMSDMYKENPTKAMEFQKFFQTQDFDKLKNDHAIGKELIFNKLNPDGSNWPEVKQAGIQNYGLSSWNQLPDQLTPDKVKELQWKSLSAEDQLKKFESDRTFQQKDRELGLKHEENSIKREQSVAEKDDKAAKELEKHLSSGWTARSGQAGSVQGKINSAEAAEQLIDQGKGQKGGLDSRQIEELAQSTSKLLGGGAQASARIEALVPHTMWGRAQSLKEWITNDPTGTGQEEFVKRMAETVAREKALAVDQMKQFQIEGLPAHARLKNKNPELYNSILEAKGIDPAMIDKSGRYKKAAPAADVGSFDHLSDDQLAELYKKAGGK